MASHGHDASSQDPRVAGRLQQYLNVRFRGKKPSSWAWQMAAHDNGGNVTLGNYDAYFDLEDLCPAPVPRQHRQMAASMARKTR